MPIDYSEYPDDWLETSNHIRHERAGDRCECKGQCGHYHPSGRCIAENGEPHPVTGSKVVLTVAHWPDHSKHNTHPDNLHALCQRCHLSLDMDRHIRNRKYGRKHDRKEQTRLF